jgi:hypothetical protein
LLDVVDEPLITKKVYIKFLKQKIIVDNTRHTFPVGKYSIPFTCPTPLLNGFFGILTNRSRIVEAVVVRPGLFSSSIRSKATIELVPEPTDQTPYVEERNSPAKEHETSAAYNSGFANMLFVGTMNNMGRMHCTCSQLTCMCHGSQNAFFHPHHSFGFNNRMNAFQFPSNNCGSSMIGNPLGLAPIGGSSFSPFPRTTGGWAM